MANRKNEIDILARTIWGEARGEGRRGMTAVAWVIRNRVYSYRWPNSYLEVCKQPFQFSVWNDKDPNHLLALEITDNDASFNAALEIARMVFDGQGIDPTQGANHYFNPNIVSPEWAADMAHVGDIGNHKFFIG